MKRQQERRARERGISLCVKKKYLKEEVVVFQAIVKNE